MKKLLLIAILLCGFAGMANAQGGITYLPPIVSRAALPGLCNPIFSPYVRLTVAPYSLSYCSATNVWTPFGNSLSLLTQGTNIIEQRNATNAQTLRLYNTYTDASNYERGFVRFSGNRFEVGTESTGTGTARNLRLINGGTLAGAIEFADTAGNIRARVDMISAQYTAEGGFAVYGSNRAFNSTGLDIVAGDTIKWRTTTFGSHDTGLARASGGIVKFTNGTTGGGNIQIGTTTAKPTCDSTTRGTIYTVFGGTGVADTTEQCRKNAADAYEWAVLPN